MQIIESIEITKFRSISKAKIDASDITIFSGKNNSGKSNVLKALNLFFKNQTTNDSPYNHERDFNLAHTGRAGGRREIIIKLNFHGIGDGKLRYPFSISRRFWNGIVSEPIYESSDERIKMAIKNNDGTVIREFTRFFNKLDYVYIPAVRDKDFVHQLFSLFERVIDGDAEKTFSEALASLNSVLKDRSRLISDDFERMLDLKTQARLSTKPSDILEAIGVDVQTGIQVTKKSGKKVPVSVDLFSNGDGILMSYIPHFLAYISRHQKNRKFIWGFEEPENSLEYSKAQMLAEKLSKEFSKYAQIFLTTHSPAFINLDRRADARLYRVYPSPNDPKGISIVATLSQLQQRLSLSGIDDIERSTLTSEVGMTELAIEIENRIRSIQSEEENLRARIDSLTTPVIYSEGNNLEYLKAAKEFFDPEGNYMILDGGGSNDLKNYYDFISKTGSRHKVIIIWDPDCQKYQGLQGTPSLLPIVLKGVTANQFITRGIEACMPEAEILADKQRFYQTKSNSNGDGGSVEILRKNQMAIYFCSEHKARSDFIAFEPIFDQIKNWLR